MPLKSIEQVVIFGSISKRSEKPDNDIDVFILAKNAQSQKEIEGVIDQLTTKCLEAFGNRLSPYILTPQQLNQKKNLGIISQVEKGIQIYPHKKEKYDTAV